VFCRSENLVSIRKKRAGGILAARRNAGYEFRSVFMLRLECAKQAVAALLFVCSSAAGGRLYRFQNCYTPEPLLPSGIFLKKMPPFTPSRGHVNSGTGRGGSQSRVEETIMKILAKRRLGRKGHTE
jgi:hypothetical protein